MIKFSTPNIVVERGPKSRIRNLGWVHILILAYIVIFPLYVFPSGSPQPSNLVVLALIGLLFISGEPLPRITSGLVPLTALVGYITLVNSVWAVLESEPECLLYALFYLFNLLVYWTAYRSAVAGGGRLLSLAGVGAIISAAIQAVACRMALVTDEFGRAVGTFNNPNQLGYFGLLCCVLAVCLLTLKRVNVWVFLLAFVLGVFLTTYSLSKAAMVSIGGLFLVGICAARGHGRWHLVGAALVVGALGLADLRQPGGGIVKDASDRILSIGSQDDDSLEGRGYNRIWEEPLYLILGAGEGATERFGASEIELHSGLGTIIFSYGLPGAFLTAWWCLTYYRKVGHFSLIILLPVAAYSLTHQNLRFSFVWFILGLVLGYSETGSVRPAVLGVGRRWRREVGNAMNADGPQKSRSRIRSRTRSDARDRAGQAEGKPREAQATVHHGIR